MSERAYSLEKRVSMTAKKASTLAYKKELNDKRAFICCDENCQIGLTCSNWGVLNGKKYYFRPSSNDELHIVGCTQISSDEEKAQIEQEKSCAKTTINKSGIIKMTKSINKARTDIGVHQEDENVPVNNLRKRVDGKSAGIGRESRNLYSLASFVDLYNDAEINHINKIIMVDSELLSLNELFVDLQSKVELDKNRIFYGKATISTGFREGMLQIDFVNRGNLRVYSNIDAVTKRSNGKIVKKYLDKNQEVHVYIRGKIISDGLREKFVPYNDSVYKDLYCVE
ncbi:hypothetical protein KQI42_17460 [Tissierella sp. MSJ-40]|uniref:Uncharacterized protein n=1 Tax=Tissierella simiarum TaxID=2841534 RepID=A0ABS6EA52_9FIRM|nr:hypothetical protein [Tissierella simiarum]MBU5439807.1 hypothetical protein [Tissierella simiarum]